MVEVVAAKVALDGEEGAEDGAGARAGAVTVTVVNGYLQKILMQIWTSIILKQCKSTEVITFLPQDSLDHVLSLFALGNEIFQIFFFLILKRCLLQRTLTGLRGLGFLHFIVLL